MKKPNEKMQNSSVMLIDPDPHDPMFKISPDLRDKMVEQTGREFLAKRKRK